MLVTDVATSPMLNLAAAPQILAITPWSVWVLPQSTAHAELRIISTYALWSQAAVSGAPSTSSRLWSPRMVNMNLGTPVEIPFPGDRWAFLLLMSTDTWSFAVYSPPPPGPYGFIVLLPPDVNLDKKTKTQITPPSVAWGVTLECWPETDPDLLVTGNPAVMSSVVVRFSDLLGGSVFNEAAIVMGLSLSSEVGETIIIALSPASKMIALPDELKPTYETALAAHLQTAWFAQSQNYEYPVSIQFYPEQLITVPLSQLAYNDRSEAESGALYNFAYEVSMQPFTTYPDGAFVQQSMEYIPGFWFNDTSTFLPYPGPGYCGLVACNSPVVAEPEEL